MFPTKYSIFYALSHDSFNTKFFKQILEPFHLFGIVIFDPVQHKKFYDPFMRNLQRFDFLTMNKFLCWCLSDDHFGTRLDRSRATLLYERKRFVEEINLRFENLEEISTYTLCNGLGINYQDLPVILLTNDFELKNYYAIKTNENLIESQLTEIGLFCMAQESKVDTDSIEFHALLNNIDSEHILIKNLFSVSKTVSDWLSIRISADPNSDRNHDVGNAEEKILEMFKSYGEQKIAFKDDAKEFEQFVLFFIGCMAQLNCSNQNDFDCTELRIENESQILINTYNKAKYYLFGGNHILLNNEIDYSILVVPLAKMFELEVNLSIVQWIRQMIGIEMPQYFRRKKEDSSNYKLLPYNKRNDPDYIPIDFNRGYRNTWNGPGLGQSYLIANDAYFVDKHFPMQISEPESFLSLWKKVSEIRNKASHVQPMQETNYSIFYIAFKNLFDHYLSEMCNLKCELSGDRFYGQDRFIH